MGTRTTLRALEKSIRRVGRHCPYCIKRPGEIWCYYENQKPPAFTEPPCPFCGNRPWQMLVCNMGVAPPGFVPKRM